MLKLIVGIVIALFSNTPVLLGLFVPPLFPIILVIHLSIDLTFVPTSFSATHLICCPVLILRLKIFLVHISRIYTQTLYINTSIRAYILTCTASLIDSNALLLLLFSSVTFVSSCFTSFSLDLPCHGTILMYRWAIMLTKNNAHGWMAPNNPHANVKCFWYIYTLDIHPWTSYYLLTFLSRFGVEHQVVFFGFCFYLYIVIYRGSSITSRGSITVHYIPAKRDNDLPFNIQSGVQLFLWTHNPQQFLLSSFSHFPINLQSLQLCLYVVSLWFILLASLLFCDNHHHLQQQ